MKKVIASSVLATSVLLPINLLTSDSVHTYAASNTAITSTQLATKALITNNNVNIRKGATTSYISIGKVQNGQLVTIIDRFTNASGELWYNVKADSMTGWVISDYVKEVSNAVGENSTIDGNSYVGSSQKIGKSATHMRSGATTSYKILSTIPSGTSLKILSSFTNAQKEVWFNVEYQGKKGWVLSELFLLGATNGETGTSMKVVNQSTVHKGATKSYATVATVKAGTTLTVHQEFTNAAKEKWMQVTYATGKKGWIQATAFEEATSDSKTVIKASNVHSGATKSYKVVATIKVGTKLAVHQEFTNATKEKWYQVTYAAGKKGWISGEAFDSVSTSPEAPPAGSPDSGQVIEQNTNLVVSVSVANMRSGPSTSYDVVTQSRLNDSFISTHYALDANNEKWYKVGTTSGEAWLHESVINVVDSSVEPPAVTPGFGETGTIKRFNALVYADSKFNSAVVQGLPINTAFTVLNKVNGTDGTNWLHIKAGAVEGWIPDFEVSDSIPTKYATKASTVFGSASATSKKIESVTASSPLRILRSLNSWLNVETQSGKRGWIQASLVSDASPVSLINGRTEVRNGQNYLVWTKPTNFKITYTMPSANVLKINGNLSSINTIASGLKGVKSMKVDQVSGGTSVLTVTFDPNYTYTIRDYDKELTIKVVAKGLAGKKIIIDAGHGAKDPGAVGPKGTKEKDVNLGTAKFLKAELEAAGAIVTLTRSTDVFLELKERTDIANASDYDAFISIHSDSFSSTSKGTTTYYNTSVNFNGPKSFTLAKSVQANLVKEVGTYNRGVKQQTFYVNRMNEIPSVLVELAFISNPSEEALLASDSFRKKAAIGIRKGLQDFFNQ